MLTKLAIAATNHLETVRCANTTTQPQKIFTNCVITLKEIRILL
ncbi:hypothetical protein [Nostoc sp. LPT]|nr:hypothetical protein [Nostoc sp. LPT]